MAYLINIAIPVVMSAMIGLIFSPSGGGNNAMGVIHLAIVDEDDSIVGEFLSGAMNNPEMQENLNLQFMDRESAMETLLDNKISGILIIPENFSTQYIKGVSVPPLELVKNPAHQVYPAVLEELLGVVVEGANAVYRVVGDDLGDWEEILEEEGVPDMTRISGLMLRMGDRFELAGEILFPPLIQYDTEEVVSAGEDDEGTGFNLFGYILPGFAGLFLFFIADNVIRDIFREEKAKTLERYRFFQGSMIPFLMSKLILSMLVICACVMLTFLIGMVLFGVVFDNLLVVIAYTAVYSFFVTGFIVFINSLAGKESRADAINGIIIFTFGFLGGNMIPANQLPDIIVDNVTVLLPNYWFINGMQHLQFGWGEVSIFGYSMVLLALGFLLLYLGARILYGQLERRDL